jgi:hypothetical protein
MPKRKSIIEIEIEKVETHETKAITVHKNQQRRAYFK